MMTFDAATNVDLPVVQALARRVWYRHYPGIITTEQIEYMLERGYAATELERFLTESGAGLAIARRESDAIAFAAWYRTDEPATTKLDKLYVAQEWQRTGIGRRLIEHVARAARHDGATTLVLNVAKRNVTAIAAYRRCGFTVREAVVVDIGSGFVMDDYVMARPV